MPALRQTITEILQQARASITTPQVVEELCQNTLTRSRTECTDTEYCELHYLLGWASRLLGHFQEAEGHLRYAVEMAGELHAPTLLADAKVQLGLLYIEQQSYQLAIDLLTDAVNYFVSTESATDEAKTLYALSNAYYNNAEEDQARQALKRALLKFSQEHDAAGVAAVHCGLAYMDIAKGRYAKAIEQIQLCKRIIPPDTHEKNLLFMDLQLAVCLFKTGQTQGAEQLVQETTKKAHAKGYHFLEAQGYFVHSCDLREHGNLAEAATLLEKVQRLSHEHHFEDALEALIARNQ